MFVRKLHDCEEFIAGDHTILREILHPGKAPLALRYSLAHATLKPDHASTVHSLRTSEVYYILEGHGAMHIDDEARDVGPRETVYIPPGTKQFIENTGSGDLRFLCIVDPAWRREDEQVFHDE